MDECPEYLIPMDELIRLGEKYGLVLETCRTFPEMYMRYREDREYEALLHRMDVVSSDGTFLSEEEREVAELYIAFCFRKK